MTDVFEEVEEQLRADRYKTLALRALPWVLGALALALIIALAIWGWGAWQSRTISEASETYAEGVEAFAAGDMGKAEQRFAEVAEGNAKGYAAMALMQQAGLRINEGKTAEAVELFDEAAQVAPDPILADAARLKSAFALLDTAPLDEMQARLHLVQGRGIEEGEGGFEAGGVGQDRVWRHLGGLVEQFDGLSGLAFVDPQAGLLHQGHGRIALGVPLSDLGEALLGLAHVARRKGLDTLGIGLRGLADGPALPCAPAPDRQRDDEGQSEGAKHPGKRAQGERLVAVGAELLLDLFKNVSHEWGTPRSGDETEAANL